MSLGSVLRKGLLTEALEIMYPGAEVRAEPAMTSIADPPFDQRWLLFVQFPGMPPCSCSVTKFGLENVIAEARHAGGMVGCVAEHIHEKLGKPHPKPPEPPKPPSGIREPYSCGHCGAPVSPDVEQCEHCKVWLVPAQGHTKKREVRSKPPPMKLPPPPQKVWM
jgi:hypothetical protein